MKRFFFIISAVCILASCSTKEPQSYGELADQINQFEEQLFQNETLSNEQKEEQFLQYLSDIYDKHLNDTLDAELFTTLLVSLWDIDEAKSKFEDAPEFIKNDPGVTRRLGILENQANTAAGKQYIDIPGSDAVTGAPVNLSDIIKSDKPTLLDFWASWCGPCRKEISNNLKALAESGEVNIIGIAVWENSLDDTQKAMEDLGISWPVIFNGGRENSISEQYGVIGIPTLFLIAPDGTFMESAHSIESMEYFKNK